MGALDYFGTWTAWERDDDKRGQLAAEIWRQANEETREAFEMGCFDALINAINNINVQTVYNQNCFCDSVTNNPQPGDYPEVTNEDGDPPEEYGGETVSDWLDWRRKVCAQANNYVDYIIAQNSQLKEAVTLGAIGIGLIAAILAILSGGGILIAVGWSAAAAVVSGLIGGATVNMFENFDSDIEAVREDIVKAIVCSQSLGTVIAGAIDSDAWNLFYQFVNWGQAAGAIRAGQVNGEYFDGTLSSNECDNYCDNSTFWYTFTGDGEDLDGSPILWNEGGYLAAACHTDSGGGSWNVHASRTGNQIRDHFGLPTRPEISKLRFRLNFSTGTGSQIDQWIRFNVIGGGGSPNLTSPEYYSKDFTANAWNDIEWDIGESVDFAATAVAFKIWLKRAESAGDGQRILIDDIRGYA